MNLDFCVHKTSKEFRALANKHNVSTDYLESFVYEYYEQTGQSERWPSDAEINARVTSVPYQETEQAVIDLWNKYFTTDNIYNTAGEANKASEVACHFFSPEHVKVVQLANNTYKLVVDQPVKETTSQKVINIYAGTNENVALNNVQAQDDAERFVGVQESQNTISSDKTILSNEELKYWNDKGVDSTPRILVASERTDPAFHVKEILDIINGKATADQWVVENGKRVPKPLSGKNFAGLYLITKHDGLPMLELLETKIPKLIHFSITTLGGTQYEPGVMKYNDLLDKIEDYIKQGLDPESVTIRIDPIIPGITKNEDIEQVVKRASEMGIKKIRFSIMDAYKNTQEAMSKLGYNFTKYYGGGFFAKPEYLNAICDFMLSLKDKYGVTLGTCAENIARNGISKEGCLSVSAVNSMLGTSIEDKGTANNNQRKLCSCYGGKVDALQYNKNCASHCIYCYAKHENDKALEYYNEDGTLKNNRFTQSRRENFEQQNTEIKKLQDKTISVDIQSTGYKKGDPQRNPDTAYVFTENLQAALYADGKNTMDEDFTPKLNVSDVGGSNQAGIRTDTAGKITPNAFGIIVKKRQQDTSGRWLQSEGQFQDTNEDFKLFVDSNERFFENLKNSGLKKIKFPSQMGLGKAALPQRFAEWLQNELKLRYGIDATINKNNRSGYNGFGLTLNSVNSNNSISANVSISAITDRLKNNPNIRFSSLYNILESFEGKTFVLKEKPSLGAHPSAKPTYYTKENGKYYITSEHNDPYGNPSGKYTWLETSRTALNISNREVIDAMFDAIDEIKEANTANSAELTHQNTQKGVTIDYTPAGKQRQTYIIEGTHIYNKEGKEVFKEDSADRNKIFANLAVQQGRAVVVNYKDARYVVNNADKIISVTSGKVMQWPENNENRKAIIELAKTKFEEHKVNSANNFETFNSGEVKQDTTINEGKKRSIKEEETTQNEDTTSGINAFDFSDVFDYPTSDAIVVEDTMKPWRSDPNKKNKSRRLYIKTKEDKGYFEIVKDNELSNYSVHFKPADDSNPDAFSQEEKQLLFRAIVDALPEGSNVSTWGELTPGDIARLNRFGDMPEFMKVGERPAKDKQTKDSIMIPVFQKVGEEKKGVITIDTKTLEKVTGEKTVTFQGEWKKENIALGEEELAKVLERQEKTGVDESQVVKNWVNYIHNVISLPANYKAEQEANKRARLEELSKYAGGELLTLQYNNLIEGIYIEEDGEITNMREDEYLEPPTVWEIGHDAGLIAYKLSETISDIINDKDFVAKNFPNLGIKKGTDFSKMSRMKVIDTIGMSALSEFVRSWVNPKTSSFFKGRDLIFEDGNLADKCSLYAQNWNIMMLIAAHKFSEIEGISFDRDFKSDTYSIKESKFMLEEDFNAPGEEVEELYKDEQEHWMIEFRTIDTLNSMADIVRQALKDCYQYDEDGNIVTSKMGIKERMHPRVVTQSILQWTQGCNDYMEMVEALQKKLTTRPWLKPILDRLSNESKDERFKSAFFTTFDKHRQNYDACILENGTYHVSDLNATITRRNTIKALEASYNLGQHPMFSKNAIGNTLVDKKKYLEYSNHFDTITRIYGEAYKQDGYRNIHQVIPNEELINNYDLISAVKGIGRLLGIDFDTTQVKEAIIEGGLQNLYFNSDGLKQVFDRINNAHKGNIWKENRGVGKFIEATYYDTERLEKEKNLNPFEDANFSMHLRRFLDPFMAHIATNTPNSFYEKGKMYQSYVIPSSLTKLMQKLTNKDQEKVREFIEKEFLTSEWYGKKVTEVNPFTRKQETVLVPRLPLLKNIYNYDDSSMRQVSHKVNLDFNGHGYMKDMTDAEYVLSLLTEYASERDYRESSWGWFRVPMLSNKPSSEFIRMRVYKGEERIEKIPAELVEMFHQEVDRIITVNMRNDESKKEGNHIEKIKTFDEKGKQFVFLPCFNDYRTGEGTFLKDFVNKSGERVENADEQFSTLLNKLINREKLEDGELSLINEYAETIIRNYMTQRTKNILEDWEKKGIVVAANRIRGMAPSDYFTSGKEKKEKSPLVIESIEDFIWNDFKASLNILQLAVGDIACYKDAEDLQKRLAEIHAPGLRGNVYARTPEGTGVAQGGVPVSADHTYRTLILKDVDKFKSDLIANISEVFDRKIAKAEAEDNVPLTEYYIDLKEQLVGKGGAYAEINVADAQGFVSPTAYRKKALQFSQWTDTSEELYQQIKANKDGKSIIDPGLLKAAFQPLKPFLFSHTKKDMGVAGAPISTVNIPVQVKNSEYLLIMADSLLRNEKTSRPNLLKAIFDIMEDSAFDKNGKYNGIGIDTVQFESTIKSGLQGAQIIDIFADSTTGEKDFYDAIHKAIYNVDGTYNTNIIQEMPFEDYSIQQNVPAHFKDHKQSHGSQERAIIPSDLDFYKNPNLSGEELNAKENIIDYSWVDHSKDAKGETRHQNAKEFRAEYDNTIADNINLSLEELRKEFALDVNTGNYLEDKKARNKALADILQREILNSPARYGMDLLSALLVDDRTGELALPIGDPIQSKRIEQLINSVIKQRVNNQKIAGGPVVQVTNFGASKKLNIRFNDKKDNLLKTKDEYIKGMPYTTKEEIAEADEAFKNYIEENQAGIAYFEVYAPIYDDALMAFADAKGNIDVKEVEKCNPELLELITYRIPTEDKYSIAHCKIVGFLPREAGEALMLPYELTAIDGSDFDVDKRYIMRKELSINRLSSDAIRNRLLNDAYKAFEGFINYRIEGNQKIENTDAEKEYNKARIKATVDKFLKRPLYAGQEGTEAEKRLRKLYDNINMYYTEAPKSKRALNNNKIIDMTWGIMSHEGSVDKILNPGGFEDVKHIGYTAEALRSGMSWEESQQKKSFELKSIAVKGKHLGWADIQEQFYRQNSAAGSLIGIFAVNRISHAITADDNLVMSLSGVDNFNIAGFNFLDYVIVDPALDREGKRISKTLASLVAASVDAVKDPILNLMNVNKDTASVFITLIRLGMPLKETALFMSQKVITETLQEYNKQKLSSPTTLDKVIKKSMQDLLNNKSASIDGSPTARENITKEALIEGVTNSDNKNHNYNVLHAFSQLFKISKEMRNLTFMTKFNSVSSAVGPLVVDNLHIEDNLNKASSSKVFFTADRGTMYEIQRMQNEGTGLSSFDGLVKYSLAQLHKSHPTLGAFAKGVSYARDILRDAPAYSATFRDIVDSTYAPERLKNNRELLDDLVMFYQGYKLITAGFIQSTPKTIKSYIEGFPKYFVEHYKNNEAYKDNALIKAITLSTERKSSNKAILKVSIVGEDESTLETYKSAWVDIQLKDPELSYRLFCYCFFRGGVGFTPKTFMSLVPTYVKTHISNPSNGAHYTKALKFEGGNPDIILDQFVRNNWQDNKLVPNVTLEESPNIKGNKLFTSNASNMEILNGITYMRTTMGNVTTLWKRDFNIGLNTDGKSYHTYYYDKITPLGNNGEYLEVSKYNIVDAYKGTTKVDITAGEKPTDVEKENNTPAEVTLDKATEAVANIVNRFLSRGEATKETLPGMGSLIQLLLYKRGINIDNTTFKKILNNFCK